MADYKLSKTCELDLAEIYEYGIERFGLRLAQLYIIGLHDLFNKLAINPGMGQKAEELAFGLRSFSYKAHIVFYKNIGDNILVVRTLSQKMDYENSIEFNDSY